MPGTSVLSTMVKARAAKVMAECRPGIVLMFARGHERDLAYSKWAVSVGSCGARSTVYSSKLSVTAGLSNTILSLRMISRAFPPCWLG